MKSFLGASAVLGFTAVTFVACGGNSNDNAKYPPGESKAMNELTPSERKESERRAAKEDDRELANARDPRPVTGTPKEVSRTSTALAVSSVATARCDRELKCKNIGTNQKYLTTDECINKLQNDKRTSINPQECPSGVSDKDLASCLKSIRDEDCGNPLDSISRLASCRSGALCLK